jgi:outer membrane protein OmpA-like peptidoglycan-associated protein
MFKIIKIIIFGLLLNGCISNEKEEYYSDKPVIMFILDTSGSMYPRIEVAKSIIIDTVAKIDTEKYNISLITFDGSCGTRLLVKPSNNSSNKIIEKIKNIYAKGVTPLAKAISDSGIVLKDIDRKTIILLSDGQETCDNNKYKPINEARKLYEKHGINIDFQIIGYAVDKETRTILQSISYISPEWNYYDANDSKSFELVINNIFSKKGLTIDGWNGNKFVFEFSPDSITLEEQYLKKIAYIFNFLKNNDKHIVIVGHTDSDGSKLYNYKLSKKRAKIVQDRLLELGIDSNRIKIEGKGEDIPLKNNQTKNGRRANRRVEIQVRL